MTPQPTVCLYCDGAGNGPGVPCGFCVEGKPLDTQEDWDASWGGLMERAERFAQELLEKRKGDQDQ